MTVAVAAAALAGPAQQGVPASLLEAARLQPIERIAEYGFIEGAGAHRRRGLTYPDR